MSSSTTHPTNNPRDEDRGLSDEEQRTLDALKAFGHLSVGVAEKGLALVARAAKSARVRSEMREDVSVDVVRALLKFGRRDVRIAYNGCIAIGGLARDPLHCAKLGECGGCRVLMFFLGAHIARNEKIALEGCLAVLNLAFNDDNRTKLGECGVCQSVVGAMRAFGATSKNVAWGGCAAVSILAIDANNRTKLGECGGCQVVVSAMRAFGTSNEDVALYGCRAVVWLACRNNDNRTKLGDFGGCQVVVDAMRAFISTNEEITENGTRSEELARDGCRAVAILARNADNATKLGDCGGCQVVVDAMRAFGASNEKVAESGCEAVANLARNNAENKTKLLSLGAMDVVMSSRDNDNKEKALKVLQ